MENKIKNGVPVHAFDWNSFIFIKAFNEEFNTRIMLNDLENAVGSALEHAGKTLENYKKELEDYGKQ
jgi:hypothetical protein